MSIRIFGIAGSTNSAEDFRLSAGGLFVPSSALNDRTGVTSTPTLTGTGSLTANVSAFTCLIDGTSNSLQGSYWVAMDAATGISIGSGSSQARIDLISMQILDNAYDASGFQKAQLVVTAGTPSGSPVAPAAPANSISLWTLPVPALATSVTFSTATAVFPYTAAVGGIVPVRSASDQPAVADAVQYRHRLDVTPATGGVSPLECSINGTTWFPVYDPAAVYGTWTNATPGSGFNVNIQPQYRTAPGNRVELRGSVLATTTISSGSTVLSGLPAPSGQRTMALPCPGQAAYSLIFSAGTTLNGSTTANSASFPTNTVLGFDGLSYSL
jgi:hypothetical protein